MHKRIYKILEAENVKLEFKFWPRFFPPNPEQLVSVWPTDGTDGFLWPETISYKGQPNIYSWCPQTVSTKSFSILRVPFGIEENLHKF